MADVQNDYLNPASLGDIAKLSAGNELAPNFGPQMGAMIGDTYGKMSNLVDLSTLRSKMSNQTQAIGLQDLINQTPARNAAKIAEYQGQEQTGLTTARSQELARARLGDEDAIKRLQNTEQFQVLTKALSQNQRDFITSYYPHIKESLDEKTGAVTPETLKRWDAMIKQYNQQVPENERIEPGKAGEAWMRPTPENMAMMSGIHSSSLNEPASARELRNKLILGEQEGTFKVQAAKQFGEEGRIGAAKEMAQARRDAIASKAPTAPQLEAQVNDIKAKIESGQPVSDYEVGLMHAWQSSQREKATAKAEAGSAAKATEPVQERENIIKFRKQQAEEAARKELEKQGKPSGTGDNPYDIDKGADLTKIPPGAVYRQNGQLWIRKKGPVR